MKLKDFFAEKYQPKKLHDKSQNSVRLYGVCFSNFSKTLGREPLLSDLTDESVMQHMRRVVSEGKAKATANRDRCCLVAIWRYAFQLKMVENFPDVPKEREPLRVPQAWLKEEIETLLSTISGLSGNMRGTPIPNWMWWRAIIMVILDTGERIEPVRRARWEWISGKSILVPAEFRKGGKRDKEFPLSPETQQLLNQIRQLTIDRTYVFPWNYCDSYLWTKYKTILIKAGLPTGRKCGFHRHRKTHASVAYAAGLDPQELLDHCDRRTTQRYLDARFSRKTQASDILAEWLRNPPPSQDRKQA